jgi:hypothetical protein
MGDQNKWTQPMMPPLIQYQPPVKKQRTEQREEELWGIMQNAMREISMDKRISSNIRSNFDKELGAAKKTLGSELQKAILSKPAIASITNETAKNFMIIMAVKVSDKLGTKVDKEERAHILRDMYGLTSRQTGFVSGNVEFTAKLTSKPPETKAPEPKAPEKQPREKPKQQKKEERPPEPPQVARIEPDITTPEKERESPMADLLAYLNKIDAESDRALAKRAGSASSEDIGIQGKTRKGPQEFTGENKERSEIQNFAESLFGEGGPLSKRASATETVASFKPKEKKQPEEFTGKDRETTEAFNYAGESQTAVSRRGNDLGSTDVGIVKKKERKPVEFMDEEERKKEEVKPLSKEEQDELAKRAKSKDVWVTVVKKKKKEE